MGEVRRDSEFIVFGSRGKYTPLTKKCLPCTYSYARNHNKKRHISAKPLPLLKYFMQTVAEGGTVLAPSIGGGTTTLAARETGQ